MAYIFVDRCECGGALDYLFETASDRTYWAKSLDDLSPKAQRLDACIGHKCLKCGARAGACILTVEDYQAVTVFEPSGYDPRVGRWRERTRHRAAEQLARALGLPRRQWSDGGWKWEQPCACFHADGETVFVPRDLAPRFESLQWETDSALRAPVAPRWAVVADSERYYVREYDPSLHCWARQMEGRDRQVVITFPSEAAASAYAKTPFRGFEARRYSAAPESELVGEGTFDECLEWCKADIDAGDNTVVHAADGTIVYPLRAMEAHDER